jgi:hypothetical protein
VPELPLGGEESVGRHGLCLTLPDGCAFDLLGMSR